MSLILAATMGNPSGVGPEILIKSVVRFLKKAKDTKVIVFGNRKVLEFYSSILEEGAEFMELIKSSRVGIADIGNLKDDDFTPGEPSEAGNIVQVEFLKEMVNNLNTYKISGIVTMPISKIGLVREGLDIPGHTDLFKRMFDLNFVQMLFYIARKPLVALNTTHIPLAQVSGAIKKDDILRNIKMLHFAMTQLFRIDDPSIAVCGLNPHAGEGGLLGKEEQNIIEPAINEAKNEGIPASGPFAADSIFYRAFNGKYKAILAMYHDQALIPVKLYGIASSVNITLGLPVIRTSPAHGTAFEIAGKGTADYRGALLSFEIARKIAIRVPRPIVWKY